MKLFFDSSVLVPVFYADHPHHQPSTSAFLAATKSDSCALRTLGEVYSTLTSLPLRPRITGPDAIRVVGQIRDKLTLVPLTDTEYLSAFDLALSEKIIGSAFYDLLIAACALKAKADVLLTWNVRDFVRLGQSVAKLVKTPLEI